MMMTPAEVAAFDQNRAEASYSINEILASIADGISMGAKEDHIIATAVNAAHNAPHCRVSWLFAEALIRLAHHEQE